MDKRQSATIEDVAARSGVSVATVSRTLRGLPHVAPATRDKVMVAAEELMYRADPHASRLAQGRTQTIGIGVPCINTWYYGQILAGVQSVLADRDYDLLVVTVANDHQRREFTASAHTQAKRVDGMVLADLFFEPGQIDDLADIGLEAVTIGVETARFDSITIDNVTGGALATRHLVDLGHRRIGQITGVEVSTANSIVSLDRRRGHEQVLSKAGIKSDQRLVADGGDTIEGAEHAMSRLLAEVEPPTAVFAHSDEMAMGAMKAVREHGLTIPDDFSIVGFDDHQISSVLGLTTIRQDVLAMAAQAARCLLDRFGEPRSPIMHSVAPTALIKRGSTGAAPRTVKAKHDSKPPKIGAVSS